MASDYEVEWTSKARRQLRKLPRTVQKDVLDAVDDPAFLAAPRDHRHVKNLIGPGEGGYRLEVGNYRALFDVDDGTRKVMIRVVRHRRDVYKRR